MENPEFVNIIENLMLEHNRMACLIEFLIHKLVDSNTITQDELSEFLNNSEAFNIQINNTYIPDPDTLLENLEMEE